MADFKYQVEGTAADDQTWTVVGKINNFREGQFFDAVHAAGAESLRQLTNGKAVYGQPGVGCNGPYKINKLVIERMS